MSAELAATPNNFEAHLSNMDSAPQDTGSSDSGAQELRDNTGPSNTNAWAQDSGQQHVNPERRAEGDAEMPADWSDVEAEPAQPEPEQQDEQQEGQGDMPAYEQLQEMYQALQTPELHEGLYDKLIPVDVNGVQVMKPISEVREGFMRMSDYSRGKQEVAEMTKHAQKVIENSKAFVQRLTNPKVFRETIRRLGPQHEQAFISAAEELAQERLAYFKMSPEQRVAHDARREAAEAQRQAQEYREALLRQQQEQQPSHVQQNTQRIQQTLDAVVPQAWERHGIRNSPLAHQIFQQHMQAVWDSNPESLPQTVERATIATAEDLAHLAQQHLGQQYSAPAPQQRQQAPRPAQPLSPRRVAPSAPVARPYGQRDTRFRSTNFEDFLKTR